MNGIKRLASFLVVASVAMGMFNAYGDGEVIVSAIDNANRTATVTFAAAEAGQKLCFVYGNRDYGEDIAEWTRNANLAEYELAVGATELTVTLPAAWGNTAFCGRFLIKGLEPLPVDALLDYVETQRKSASDGSAGTYIRTGIYPNQDTCVEMDFELASSLNSNQFQTFFCAREVNSGGFTLSLNYLCQGRYDNLNNGSTFAAFLSSTPGTRYVLKNVGNTLTAYKQSDHSVVNSLTGGNAAGTIFNAPEMILFMATNSGNPNNNACSLKFYSFKLRDGEDGKLLADYVPAQKDGVAGIYDYVSNNFIPSANPTYQFGAGSSTNDNPKAEFALAWSESQVGFSGLIGTGGRIFPALDGSGDVVHIFDAAGDYEFTAPAVDIELTYLIVGGGGSGGRGVSQAGAGGGGGGGVISNINAVSVLPKTKLQIKVGMGSVAPIATATVAGFSGEPGEDSSIVGLDADGQLVAIGGGGGCGANGAATLFGGDGGNGGGGACQGARGGEGLQLGLDANGDRVTVGYDGGTGAKTTGTGGAGGGGAGEVGQANSAKVGGRGGDGAKSDITGEEAYYGGGGGGGNYNGANNANRGGYGGGGDGAANGYDANRLPQAGVDGFGGGGGGGGSVSANVNGADGGDGCVILRYHPPENRLCGSFEVVDAGPAYIRFACQLTSMGPVGDMVKLEVARGVDAMHLGQFQVLSASWQEGETFDYAATGLEVGQNYCFRFRITNLDDDSVFEREVEAATIGFLAGGGDEVYQLPNDWMVHVFTTPGTYEFTVPYGGIDLRYLIVGGGGAGGAGNTSNNGAGGGGGGGGVLTNDLNQLLALLGGTKVMVTVGEGGMPAVNSAGGTGQNSSIAATDDNVEMNLIGYGGGGGGSNSAGGDGGNGGGGAYNAKAGGTGLQTVANGYQMGSEVIGKVGGNAISGQKGSAGGGGAGEEGKSPSASYLGGIGGDGAWSDITGEMVCYGGGGGGGPQNPQPKEGNGDGGNGGGGNGAQWHGISSVQATAGADGLGGGGGGGSMSPGYRDGANGGSGIVVLSYLPSETLPVEPVGKLEGIEIKDVKVKGDATNVVEEVAYKVEWAGNGADFADVSLVYGAAPDALVKEKLIAKNVIGSSMGVCKLTQSWKEGREYYVALKITSGAGTMVTEPVQVSLPKRIPPQFPAVIVR